MKEHEKKEQRKLGTKRKPIIGLHRMKPIDYGVTKKQFFAVLEKVSQPIKNSESETETTQTSESHPNDGCNGRRTRSDKTEGT